MRDAVCQSAFVELRERGIELRGAEARWAS